MKNKITILIALAAVFSASATSPAGYPAAKAGPAVPDTAGTRWHINGDYSIRWDIGNDIPHYDHLEMSGEQVSVVYYYGVDGDGSFSMERSVVWPMLRTIPNDTHASLTVRFNTDFLSGVTVDGQKLEGEKVRSITFDGLLRTECTYSNADIKVTECYFPSPARAAICEEYTLSNTGDRTVTVFVPAVRNVTSTDPNAGPEGSYTLIEATGNIKDRTYSIAPGESITVSASIQGLKKPQVEIPINTGKEKAEREEFVDMICGKLAIDCPDEVLNTMFGFCKIRGAESIFRTRGGLMQSPGGEAYYAALWCNDQAEYINPFFPFLGYDKGNESAITSFMHFARYMNPEFNYIPWSVIAEGYDTFGRFDRGDAAMLAYGATRYALALGDLETAETLMPLIDWSLEYCRRNINDDGVVASTADELELRFPAGDANLCTSSLYYDALRSTAWLIETMAEEYASESGISGDGTGASAATGTNAPISLSEAADRAADLRAQADTLRQNIEKHFGAEMNGYHTYRYFEGNDVLRSWICIPLVMEIFDRKEGTAQALLSPILWSENGVYTEAGTDVFWDRATLYALRGIYAAGYSEEATEHLAAYSRHRLLGDHIPYPVEAWPEGNQRHLSTENALYCRVFTEGVLGFRPTGFRTFTLRPQLPDSWDRFTLRNVYACSDRPYDILVRRSGEQLSITIRQNGRDIRAYNIEEGSSVEVSMKDSGYQADIASGEVSGIFDPYILAIPDRDSTPEQMATKKALNEILYNCVSAEGDRFVFGFDRKTFAEKGLSEEYCKWMKNELKETEKNFRKMKRNGILPDSLSLGKTFTDSKDAFRDAAPEIDIRLAPASDLFSYGGEVSSPEDNLKNLFRNFPEIVSSDIPVELVSYRYEGTVSDASRLTRLLKINLGKDMPHWNYSSSAGAPGKPAITLSGTDEVKSAKAEKKAIGMLNTHFIKTGYEIYSILFRYGSGEEYRYYIFIDPDTDRPVTKLNQFALFF